MMGNFRHVIGLLVVVAVAGGFYYVATSDNIFSAQKSRAEYVDKRTEQARVEIITPLQTLNVITLDSSLFASREYKTLQDKSLKLNPPVLVRSNPFSQVY